MSTGHYTRNMFSEVKRYQSMLLQRSSAGRPIFVVDSDFTDWARIQLNQHRRLAQLFTDGTISPTDMALQAGGYSNDFIIGAGRGLVSGFNAYIAPEGRYTCYDGLTYDLGQADQFHRRWTSLAANTLVDVHAKYNTNALAGYTLTLMRADGLRTYTITSNTQNTITVTGLDPLVASDSPFYFIALKTPLAPATQEVWLDCHEEDWGAAEDSDLNHNMRGSQVEASRRLKLIQSVLVQQGNFVTLVDYGNGHYGYVDASGTQHYCLKLGELNRTTSAVITSAHIDNNREEQAGTPVEVRDAREIGGCVVDQPETLSERLDRDTVWVTVGDGVDTFGHYNGGEGLAAAVACGPANIFVKPGTYTLNDVITLQAGTRLTGGGATITVTDLGGFVMEATTEIANLTLTRSDVSSNAVVQVTGINAKLVNCYISDGAANPASVIVTSDSKYGIVIEGCYIAHGGGTALQANACTTTSSTPLVVADCVLTSSSSAAATATLVLNNPGMVRVSNCAITSGHRALDAYTQSVNANGTVTSNNSVVLTDCTMVAATGSDYTGKSLVRVGGGDIKFYNCQLLLANLTELAAAAWTNTVLIETNATYATNLTLVGTHIQCAINGIKLSDTYGNYNMVELKDCTVEGSLATTECLNVAGDHTKLLFGGRVLQPQAATSTVGFRVNVTRTNLHGFSAAGKFSTFVEYEGGDLNILNGHINMVGSPSGSHCIHAAMAATSFRDVVVDSVVFEYVPASVLHLADTSAPNVTSRVASVTNCKMLNCGADNGGLSTTCLTLNVFSISGLEVSWPAVGDLPPNLFVLRAKPYPNVMRLHDCKINKTGGTAEGLLLLVDADVDTSVELDSCTINIAVKDSFNLTNAVNFKVLGSTITANASVSDFTIGSNHRFKDSTLTLESISYNDAVAVLLNLDNCLIELTDLQASVCCDDLTIRNCHINTEALKLETIDTTIKNSSFTITGSIDDLLHFNLINKTAPSITWMDSTVNATGINTVRVTNNSDSALNMVMKNVRVITDYDLVYMTDLVSDRSIRFVTNDNQQLIHMSDCDFTYGAMLCRELTLAQDAEQPRSALTLINCRCEQAGIFDTVSAIVEIDGGYYKTDSVGGAESSSSLYYLSPLYFGPAANSVASASAYMTNIGLGGRVNVCNTIITSPCVGGGITLTGTGASPTMAVGSSVIRAAGLLTLARECSVFNVRFNRNVNLAAGGSGKPTGLCVGLLYNDTGDALDAIGLCPSQSYVTVQNCYFDQTQLVLAMDHFCHLNVLGNSFRKCNSLYNEFAIVVGQTADSSDNVLTMFNNHHLGGYCDGETHMPLVWCKVGIPDYDGDYTLRTGYAGGTIAAPVAIPSSTYATVEPAFHASNSLCLMTFDLLEP